MPRKPIFAIDHDELLRKTRSMCSASRRTRDKAAAARGQRVRELQQEVEACRQRVISLRNDKSTQAFRDAKVALEDARRALSQASTSAAFDPMSTQAMEDVDRMMTLTSVHRAAKASAPERLRKRLEEETLKEAQRVRTEKKHARAWDPSIQAGNMIMRPFIALGPSDPSLLRPPGTRFDGTRPKVPWLAVPEGQEFGYTPVPARRRRHTVSHLRGRRSHNSSRSQGIGQSVGVGAEAHDQEPVDRSPRTRFADNTVPGGDLVGSGGGASAFARGSKRKGRRGTASTIRSHRSSAVPAAATERPRPSWKAADGVSRVFSTPAYNRPQTAHERAQAALMVTCDRRLYRATRAGKHPWKPVRQLSRPFSIPAHNEPPPVQHTQAAPTEASSFFDGA